MLAPKQYQQCTIDDLLCLFPVRSQVKITRIFPMDHQTDEQKAKGGEYWVGFSHNNREFRPGFPHYFDLKTAIRYAVSSFVSMFPDEEERIRRSVPDIFDIDWGVILGDQEGGDNGSL